MEGITILNQFIHEGAIIQPWFTIGICLCIGGMIGVVGFCTITDFSKKTWAKVLAAICTISVFVGVFISILAPREEITRYQVLIGDEVNFNEFHSEYEIVQQDGLIFTIEEREP